MVNIIRLNMVKATGFSNYKVEYSNKIQIGILILVLTVLNAGLIFILN